MASIVLKTGFISGRWAPTVTTFQASRRDPVSPIAGLTAMTNREP
jgi:hypothetical protein